MILFDSFHTILFSKWSVFYWSFIAVGCWANVYLFSQVDGGAQGVSMFGTLGVLSSLLAVDMIRVRIRRYNKASKQSLISRS
jgi:hypothetical protein